MMEGCLPFDAMREDHEYTYTAGVKSYEHIDQRRCVINRVQEICDENGVEYSVKTPETLLEIAHILHDCECEDLLQFDELLIIDGSDRAHVYTCVVWVPWSGRIYEIAGGNSLEGDFTKWVQEAAGSVPDDDDVDQDKTATEVSGLCANYFFKVRDLRRSLRVHPAPSRRVGGRRR
jgi:hypothetical protein